MASLYDCTIPGPYTGTTINITAYVESWRGFLQIVFTSPHEIGQAVLMKVEQLSSDDEKLIADQVRNVLSTGTRQPADWPANAPATACPTWGTVPATAGVRQAGTLREARVSALRCALRQRRYHV